MENTTIEVGRPLKKPPRGKLTLGGAVREFQEGNIGVVFGQQREERLLEGVLHGEIPISIAIQIVAASDGESQRVLVEAFERKELTQKSVAAFRRILDLRRNFGRRLASRDNAPVAPHATADSIIAAYKREAQRQKLLIKKAKVCETRLFALAAGLQKTARR